MTRRTLVLPLAVLGCSLGLSSCLIPETFEVHLTINKDGSYAVVYDGTLVFALARAAQLEARGSMPDDDGMLADIKKELSQSEHVTHVQYLGDARYKLRYEREGMLNSPVSLPEEDIPIAVIRRLDGLLVEVRGMEVSDEDMEILRELRMTIDGSLKVQTSAKVLEHNAHKTPWRCSVCSVTTSGASGRLKTQHHTCS